MRYLLSLVCVAALAVGTVSAAAGSEKTKKEGTSSQAEVKGKSKSVSSHKGKKKGHPKKAAKKKGKKAKEIGKHGKKKGAEKKMLKKKAKKEHVKPKFEPMDAPAEGGTAEEAAPPANDDSGETMTGEEPMEPAPPAEFSEE